MIIPGLLAAVLSCGAMAADAPKPEDSPAFQVLTKGWAKEMKKRMWEAILADPAMRARFEVPTPGAAPTILDFEVRGDPAQNTRAVVIQIQASGADECEFRVVSPEGVLRYQAVLSQFKPIGLADLGNGKGRLATWRHVWHAPRAAPGMVFPYLITVKRGSASDTRAGQITVER